MKRKMLLKFMSRQADIWISTNMFRILTTWLRQDESCAGFLFQDGEHQWYYHAECGDQYDQNPKEYPYHPNALFLRRQHVFQTPGFDGRSARLDGFVI